MTRSRIRGLVLLAALLGAQLMTVSAALAGDLDCTCNAEMCVHHPGQDHSRHAHQASTQSAATPATAHCHDDAGVAPPECSMRGCQSDHEHLVPTTTLGSLPHPTAIVADDSLSAAPTFASRPLLDRASAIEPPPPRTSLV